MLIQVQKHQFLFSHRRYSVAVWCVDMSTNAEKTFALDWGWWRTQHFVRNLFEFGKYAVFSFSPFKGIHFSLSSGSQQNLSSSPFRVNVDDDLWAFFFFEVLKKKIFTVDIASEDRSSKQESVVHVNRRVTGSRVYIIRIFDLCGQFNISGGKASLSS